MSDASRTDQAAAGRAASRYVPALGFHALTRLYDPVVALTTREKTFKRALIAQARLRPGLRVLDLASGTGTLAIWMKQAEPAAGISGVDGDAAIIAIARGKADAAGLDIDWNAGFSTALPFATASFDRVTSSLFFHHLQRADKARSFAEALRVLKPGGELHVADWGAPHWRLMRLAYVQIQLLDGWSNTGDNVRGILPVLMSEAGFADVRVRKEFATVFGTMTLYSARKE